MDSSAGARSVRLVIFKSRPAGLTRDRGKGLGFWAAAEAGRTRCQRASSERRHLRGPGVPAAWEWGRVPPGPPGTGHLYTAIQGSSAKRGNIHLPSISSPMKASRMAISWGMSLWGGAQEVRGGCGQRPSLPSPPGHQATGSWGSEQGERGREPSRAPAQLPHFTAETASRC